MIWVENHPADKVYSAENGGPAFSTTINQFKSLQQEGVSIADMIVLGAITAVAVGQRFLSKLPLRTPTFPHQIR